MAEPCQPHHRRAGRCEAAAGDLLIAVAAAGGHLHPPLLLAPAPGAGGHVPHVPGGDRGAARPGSHHLLHHPGGRGHGGPHRLGRGQEGPGGGPRVPPRQPPPRLPGLRQGRGVPAPGPDAVARAGGEPLRRGEAPLRQAHPDLRPGAARPGALHPLRPLHPLRRRDRRRPADRVRLPGQLHPGAHLPRTSPSPPTSRATPCRSARWGPSPPPPTDSGPGPGTWRRWRAPARTARWAAASSVQASHNEVVRFLGVDNGPTNQGWLCDKGRFGFEYLHSPERLTTPLVRGKDGELRRATWGEALEKAASGLRRVIDGQRGRRRGRPRAGRAAPTRRPTPSASSSGPRWAPTTSTPASATPWRPGFLTGLPHRAAIDDLDAAEGDPRVGPRPQGGTARPLPAGAPRGRRAWAPAWWWSTRGRTGLDPVAAHVLRYRPGGGSGVARRSLQRRGRAGAGGRAPWSNGPLVAIVGRTGLAETPSLAEAVAAFADGLARGQGAAGGPARQPLRGPRHGGGPRLCSPAGCRWPTRRRWEALDDALGRRCPGGEGDDAAGIIDRPRGRDASGPWCCSAADPAADLPRPGPGRRRPGARRPGGGHRPLPQRVVIAAAHVVLPALGFAEVEGTVTNLEGRVQKVNRLVPGPGQARSGQRDPRGPGRPPGPLHRRPSRPEALADEIAAVAPAYAGSHLGRRSTGAGARREGLPPAHSRLPTGCPWKAPAGGGGAWCSTSPGCSTTGGPWCSRARRWPASTGAAVLRLHPADAARLGRGRRAAGCVSPGAGGAAELPAVASTPPSPRERSTCRPTSGCRWAAACGLAWRPCRERARAPLRQRCRFTGGGGQGGGSPSPCCWWWSSCWCGSSARSWPTCRTASAPTGPAPGASCRPWPTASSCSSRSR